MNNQPSAELPFNGLSLALKKAYLLNAQSLMLETAQPVMNDLGKRPGGGNEITSEMHGGRTNLHTGLEEWFHPDIRGKDDVAGFVAGEGIVQKMPTKIYSRKSKESTAEKAQSCPICAEELPTPALFLKHILTHTGEKPHSCGECGCTFVKQTELASHSKIHCKNVYSWELGGKTPLTFVRQTELDSHSKIHSMDRWYPWELGGKTPIGWDSLPYPNSFCSAELSCERCGRRFLNLAGFRKHMSAHEERDKRLTCELCGRMFTQLVGLKAHKKVHFGEKPFARSECDAAFVRRDMLKVHMQVHTDEKRYTCKVCKGTFAQAASLAAHRQMHLEEKNNSCDICGKKFSRPYHLKRHQDSHAGKKPFKCDLCGKHFTQDSGLKMHATIHSGERRHRCTICDKGFARAWHLKRHIETHERKKKAEMKKTKIPMVNEPEKWQNLQTTRKLSIKAPNLDNEIDPSPALGEPVAGDVEEKNAGTISQWIKTESALLSEPDHQSPLASQEHQNYFVISDRK